MTPAVRPHDDTALDTDVLILGGRIAANLSAAYLRRKLPELRVTTAGRTDGKVPVVGESLIEASTLFLHECGLTTALEEGHYHKYGLTFYFKTRLDDPDDSTYSIHEEPAVPPLPAKLINRFTFDRDVREHNAKSGVEHVEGTVTGVLLEKGAHVATVKTADGSLRRLRARWIIDATGRSRVLGKELGLTQPPRWQRSTFWFRLADFDESILLELIDEMRARYPQMAEQIAYDPYYVTHHFMGRGNWIWLIPITSEDGRRLISIGITYRPDLYPRSVRSMSTFLEGVAGEHPVVAELVRSGTVVDTNTYQNYMYHASQHYSTDGWFVVGDAANAVDPLFSNGIFLQSMQIMQVTEMIRRDALGELDADCVQAFDGLYGALYHRAQNIIGRFYEVMHDPYQSHLRMHWTTAIYFYVVLPWFMSNYHVDVAGAKLMRHLIETSVPDDDSAYRLFGEASQVLGEVSPDDLFNWYDQTINYRLLAARERDLPLHLGRYALLNARIRLRSLRQARGRGLAAQLPVVVRDMARSALLHTAFRGASLRRSGIFHRLMGTAPPRPHELSAGLRPMLDGSLPVRPTWQRAAVVPAPLERAAEASGGVA